MLVEHRWEKMLPDGELISGTVKTFRGLLEVPWSESEKWSGEKMAHFLAVQEWNARQVAEDVGDPIDPAIQAARDRWIASRRRILRRDRARLFRSVRCRERFRKLYLACHKLRDRTRR